MTMSNRGMMMGMMDSAMMRMPTISHASTSAIE